MTDDVPYEEKGELFFGCHRIYSMPFPLIAVLNIHRTTPALIEYYRQSNHGVVGFLVRYLQMTGYTVYEEDAECSARMTKVVNDIIFYYMCDQEWCMKRGPPAPDAQTDSMQRFYFFMHRYMGIRRCHSELVGIVLWVLWRDRIVEIGPRLYPSVAMLYDSRIWPLMGRAFNERLHCKSSIEHHMASATCTDCNTLDLRCVSCNITFIHAT